MSAVESFYENANVDPVVYLPLPMFERKFGMTKNAVRKKIQAGKWIEGQEYVKDPDGLIHINILNYQKWVESVWLAKKEQEAAFQSTEINLRSTSIGSTPKAQVSSIVGASKRRKRIVLPTDKS